jgi:hypothetical protein
VQPRPSIFTNRNTGEAINPLQEDAGARPPAANAHAAPTQPRTQQPLRAEMGVKPPGGRTSIIRPSARAVSRCCKALVGASLLFQVAHLVRLQRLQSGLQHQPAEDGQLSSHLPFSLPRIRRPSFGMHRALREALAKPVQIATMTGFPSGLVQLGDVECSYRDTDEPLRCRFFKGFLDQVG